MDLDWYPEVIGGLILPPPLLHSQFKSSFPALLFALEEKLPSMPMGAFLPMEIASPGQPDSDQEHSRA